MTDRLAQVKATCREHELVLVRGERCPYCTLGVAPLRVLRAIKDFANLPMPGTLNVPASVPSIRYSEVVRRIGRQLVALEAERLERCADLDLRSRELRKDMKRARLAPAKMLRAVRIPLGYPKERADLDEVSTAYLSVIEDDGVNW